MRFLTKDIQSVIFSCVFCPDINIKVCVIFDIKRSDCINTVKPVKTFSLGAYKYVNISSQNMNVISANALDIFIFGGFFGVTGSDGKSIVLSGAFKDKAALSRIRYSVENTVVFIPV